METGNGYRAAVAGGGNMLVEIAFRLFRPNIYEMGKRVEMSNSLSVCSNLNSDSHDYGSHNEVCFHSK